MSFPGQGGGGPRSYGFGGDGSGFPGSSNGGFEPPAFVLEIPKLITAHAVLMTSAFLFFYPMGALLTRLPLPSHFLKFHVPFQILGLILSVSGVGVGIKLANYTRTSISHQHTTIGLVVVFTLLGLQPTAGWLQHRYYKRTGRRGFMGSWHIWLGRAMIILGIVNGGLGLKLAGDTRRSRTKAYIAVATVVGILYGLAIVFDVFRQRSLRNLTGFPGEKPGARRGSDDSLESSKGRAHPLPRYSGPQSYTRNGRTNAGGHAQGSRYMNTWV